MKKILLFLFLSVSAAYCFGQSEQTDSSKNLAEIIIKAFEQNKQLKQVSTAVNYIGQAQLQRFNNMSILPALNSTAGVHMEERSPGSYRMNIRGSTLRSPFGVRNIKIYWDEISFTDAGGNTYLNQLSFYDFNSIEIIKGPGGSLYGAGTGGVMLIHSEPAVWQKEFDATLLGGSYGLLNGNVQISATKTAWQNVLKYSHQNSDGYRDHTALRRDVLNWQTKLVSGASEEVKFSALYGDLYYQTPGALTKAEYEKNAKAARPKSGTLPSADSAKAAIYQKTFLAGFTNKLKFSTHFSNTTVIYGAFTDLTNPTFRNYERRTEPQWGTRTVFNMNYTLQKSLLQIIFGSEFQKGYFNTKDYVNKNGRAGNIITNDDIHPKIFSVFLQSNLQLKKNWDITAAISINNASITIDRLSVQNFIPVKRNFKSELSPRLAVSKKITDNLWLYGSMAKGFSPPTVAEVLPSTSVISTDLQAEEGLNYEIGIKSTWLNKRLYAEANAFYYRLRNAIVSRKDASNADYFMNAGSTKQRGIESQFSYFLFQKKNSFITAAKFWMSETWYQFKYDHFKQSTTDFSGNKLPGVPSDNLVAGLDLSTKNGLFSNLTYSFTGKIALNDANTDFSSSYHLLSEKLGWKKLLNKKMRLDIFIGGENLLNVKYSLGNDINAAGGRYYNVAPARSFFAGLHLHAD